MCNFGFVAGFGIAFALATGGCQKGDTWAKSEAPMSPGEAERMQPPSPPEPEPTAPASASATIADDLLAQAFGGTAAAPAMADQPAPAVVVMAEAKPMHMKPSDPRAATETKTADGDFRADSDDAEEYAANEDEGTTGPSDGKAAGPSDQSIGGESRRSKGDATRASAVTVMVEGVDTLRNVPPETVLPRMFYFENTYLGGSAAYAERLRQLDQALGDGERPYRLVAAESQPFDPPRQDGLALHATVDATHVDEPRRVFLQVGIRGSERHGWRRPPIDAVLVIDASAGNGGPEHVTAFVTEALRQLGPTDRLGVFSVAAGTETEVLPLMRIEQARQALAHRIDALASQTSTGAGSGGSLGEAMRKAGGLLAAASESPHAVPGTRMVLLLTGDKDVASVRDAALAAHELTLQGAVTSVFSTVATSLPWWQVADAGYGNWHRIPEVGQTQAFSDELAALARVVARLLRVNIRLGRNASAIRVLGTRVLEAREVDRVKARELAADRNLSKTLGIVSDRGDDDDGIQTVIPYFLGDDSHVILVELWVEGPGVVADISLRYKDMVNLDNGAARVSVQLGSRPRPAGPEQAFIARNVNGFLLGEELQRASFDLQQNRLDAAKGRLERAQNIARQTNPEDREAIDAMQDMVEEGRYDNRVMGENLLMSGQRRVGTTRR